MSLISQFKNNASFKAVEDNPRLQWMLTAVVAILCLSAGKSALDSLAEPIQEAKAQHTLLAKLRSSEQQSVDIDFEERHQAELSQLLNVIPVATSESTAEAKTLSEIESLIGQHVDNLRMSLLGTEAIRSGNETFWTVRVDIAGQAKEKSMISILEHFDGEVSNSRMSSLQYSPKTSNSIKMVVDMLYREQK